MATEFDISQQAAGVYAQSLLELAEEAQKAEQIGQELRELRRLWRDEPTFAALMTSAAIDMDARRDCLNKAFGDGRVDSLVLRLMLVLNQHRRPMVLPLVAEAYCRKLDEHLGRREAMVRTAVPLSDPQRDVLRKQLKRLTGNDAILVEKVEPEVLGGLRVQIVDRLYDMTLQRQLRELRKKLLDSVADHIRAGDKRFFSGV